MDNPTEGQEPQKTPEGDPKPEEGEEKELTEEQLADLKKKASESSQNFERAKKAEDELKTLKKAPKPKEEAPKVETPKGGLSDEDLIYVAKSDIHDEDLSEVREYAEKHEVSIREAHKYLKPVLDVKTQERKTAEATQTKGGKRGASNISGEAMLKEASQDNMVPEDDKGIEALVAAEMAAKEADLPKRQ